MPVDITLKTIERAKRDAAAGRLADITDARARGLVLRVRRRRLLWTWRGERGGRQHRLVLGEVGFLTIAEARQLADAATAWLRDGHGVPAPWWLSAELEKLGKVSDQRPLYAGGDEEERPSRPLRLGWTWSQAVGRYVAAKADDGARPATVADYRKTLLSPALKPLRHDQVDRVRVDELQRIIDDLARTRATQAEAIWRKVRTFYSWLARPGIRDQSGVQRGHLDDLEKPRARRDGPPRQRYPTVVEVGALLARARSADLRPGHLAAITLLVATGQRRLTIVQTTADQIQPWPGGPAGWARWVIPPASQKSRLQHVVPLPPAVVAALPRRDAGWLFPAARPRRAGDPPTHMSESTLTHLLADLDAGFSPHDLRRALRNAREALGTTREILALILDHAEGRASEVTERHYADDEMLDVKTPVIKRWWTLVDAAAHTIEK